jgi:hypothetical protein
LRKRVEVFSFDDEQLKARISTGERWQQLLQAHLYFDHVITRLLVDELANPDAIDARRMSFLQKLRLTQALGLIPTDLASSVEFINGLRNKIAHDLDFEISDKDERDLANCTPKRLRDIMASDNKRDSVGPLRFHELLRIVLLQIEVTRQSHAFVRLHNRKAEIRLRTVLEKTATIKRNEVRRHLRSKQQIRVWKQDKTLEMQWHIACDYSLKPPKLTNCRIVHA